MKLNAKKIKKTHFTHTAIQQIPLEFCIETHILQIRYLFLRTIMLIFMFEKFHN